MRRRKTWERIEKEVAAGLYDDEPLPSSDELLEKLIQTMRDAETWSPTVARAFAAGLECGMMLTMIKTYEMRLQARETR